MNLEEATRLFEEKGLYVTRAPQAFGNGIQVAGAVDKSHEIWALHNLTRIYLEGPQWVFNTQEGVLDDVVFKVATLDEAVDHTLRRYFGKPIILGGWLFPVHMHPEWELARLKRGLLHAETVTLTEWQALQREINDRHKELCQNGSRAEWDLVSETHPELVYRRIPHAEDTHQELWMSRAGLKMYVVRL